MPATHAPQGPDPRIAALTDREREILTVIAQGWTNSEIAARLLPCEEKLVRLETIPGVGRRTAEILAAEIGLDMNRFPSAAHLASWAGMCPGNYESAGKRQKGKTRKGSKWLRTALVEAGQAAARKKDSYLAAQYHRLVPRLGKKKAAVAVARKLAVLLHKLWVTGEVYDPQYNRKAAAAAEGKGKAAA